MNNKETSLDKALIILKYILNNQKNGVRLTDIYKDLSLPKSTAFRLTQILEKHLLIKKNEQTKRFYLGKLSEELGQASSNKMALINQYEKLIQAIAYRTGDATFLVIQQGLDTLCIARAIGTFPIQALTIKVGNRQPIGIGAGGLAMLAAFEEEKTQHLISQNSARFERYHYMTKRKMFELISATKNKGYSVIGSYAVKEVTGVGVVLRNRENKIIGGVSTATLSHRVTTSYAQFLATSIQQEIHQFYK